MLRNAINGSRTAESAALVAPTADVPAVTTNETVEVAGSATWASTVILRRGSEVIGESTTTADGRWAMKIPLDVGQNAMIAVATDPAGECASSEPLVVTRWQPAWEVVGEGRARPVMIELAGATSYTEPADSAVLVIGDANGAEAARHEMRWTLMRYLHVLSCLPGGVYSLAARLEIDGLVLEIDGPDITIPERRE